MFFSFCSCSFEISVETKPFEKAQVTMCENIEQGIPEGISHTFSKANLQICAFLEAQLKTEVSEFFSTEEHIRLIFSWYHKGEEIFTVTGLGTIASDGVVVADSCKVTNDQPFSTGEYFVVVKFGNIEIARQSFVVE